MYHKKVKDREIDIKLDNGLYLFPCTSGTGKTLLKKYLEILNEDGENVATVDYKEYAKGLSVEKILEQPYAVIMIDRYDLFDGGLLDELIKASEHSAVIVDCKRGLPVPHKVCCIHLEKDKIEVV